LQKCRSKSPAERSWLQAYQTPLKTEFPGCGKEISIFGSKARGDARADSDLDVLVVIREGDWHVKEALTRPGYDLAIGTDGVPSLHVYTTTEWEQRRAHASVFREVVERDRVPAP
jgi:predicted nucleotidyltransferase